MEIGCARTGASDSIACSLPSDEMWIWLAERFSTGWSCLSRTLKLKLTRIDDCASPCCGGCCGLGAGPESLVARAVAANNAAQKKCALAEPKGPFLMTFR